MPVAEKTARLAALYAPELTLRVAEVHGAVKKWTEKVLRHRINQAAA
jgi:hypothetical protein